jgi:hypothetical protein
VTAAAAAAVGGLAGALKAFSDRSKDGSDELQETEPQPEGQSEPDGVDATDDEPSDEHDDEHAEGEENEDEDEDERQHDRQASEPQPAAAASGEVGKVIGRARQHVEQVVGEEPEGVSGIERMNGNWCVSVETVKLHRIPDSTDILASYAVVVDADGDLVSLQETRRYRRSQSEEDR